MSNKINVLHYIPGFNFGGIESRMLDILKLIDKEKFQLDFMILTDKDNPLVKEIEKNGGRVYKIPPFTPRTLKEHFYSIKKILDENSYDIIHSHSSDVGFLLLKYAKQINIKGRIQHSRTSSFKGYTAIPIRKLMQKLSVYYANHYLAVSNLAGKWFFGNRNFSVIPNSINIEEFLYNSSEREKIRKEYNVSDKVVFGHIGRNTKQKNHEFLFEIYKEILSQNKNSVLMLIGVSEEDKNLVDYIEKLGIKDNIIFCGYQKEMSKYYNAMDALIFPSFYEGMPGTIIEAQASGLKSYCSTKITEEIALTENVEFISLKESASNWADFIIKSLDNQKSRRSYKNELINKGFTIEKTVEKFESVYLNIIKNKQ